MSVRSSEQLECADSWDLRKSQTVCSTQSQKLAVPPEFARYLKRLETKDILNYLKQNDEVESNSKKCSPKDFALKIMQVPQFDIFMAVVILFNLLAMIIETDRSAIEEDSSDAEIHWTTVFGWVALLIFVCELSVRILALQREFWRDRWNIFDFIVVVLDALCSLVSIFTDQLFPLTVLRIFRLAKMSRVFKVVRVFPELRLLCAGLFSAVSAIFWGTVLLFMSMLLWAMVAVLVIHPLNSEIDYGDCERCPRAYKSVLHASLTFSQGIVCGDSWGKTTIPVMERYPASALFFILVYLSVGMAVTNLILGFVVNVAHQTVSALSEEDNAHVALAKLGRHTQLLELCKRMDTDNSGELSRDEVFAAFETPGEFRETMLGLEITTADFEIVWTILDDDKNGSVSYKEFVSCLSSMKLSDTQFMLSYIKYYITLLKNSLSDKIDRIEEHQHDDFARQVTEYDHDQNIRKLEEHAEEILQSEYSLLQEVEALKAHCHPQELSRIKQNGTKMSPAEIETASIEASHSGTSARQHGKMQINDATHCITAAMQDDKLQREFDVLRSDLNMMRMELKDMLTDMDRKYCLPETVSDLISTRAQANLLVVPHKATAKAPSRKFSPLCCRAHTPQRAPER